MTGFLRVLSAGGFIMTILMAGRGANQPGGLLSGNEMVFLPLALLFGLMIIFTWTPFLGEVICRPITSAIEGDPDAEEITFLLYFADWFLRRKMRRFGILFCFWEALIHPGWPTPWYAAMKNSKRGSWSERWFAERVWKGRNAHFCLDARQTLERHGIVAGSHPEPEIARLMASWDRKTSTALNEPISLEKHVNKPPVRDDRITLFESGNTALPGYVRRAPQMAPVSIAVADTDELDDDCVFADVLDEDEDVIPPGGEYRSESGATGKSDQRFDARVDPLRALMERGGGVRLNSPGPGAVVEWLRESFANSLIRSVDARAPTADQKPTVKKPTEKKRPRT